MGRTSGSTTPVQVSSGGAEPERVPEKINLDDAGAIKHKLDSTASEARAPRLCGPSVVHSHNNCFILLHCQLWGATRSQRCSMFVYQYACCSAPTDFVVSAHPMRPLPLPPPTGDTVIWIRGGSLDQQC